MGEVDRTGFPEQSYFYLHVPGPDIATDASPLKDLAEDSVGDKYIRIANNANASDYYKIESIEPVNAVKSETTYDAYSGTFVQDDEQAAKYQKLFYEEIGALNDEDNKRGASGGNVQINFNGRGLI